MFAYFKQDSWCCKIAWSGSQGNEMRGGRAEKQGGKENIVNLKTFKVSQSEDRAHLWCFWEKIMANSQFQHDWNCFNKEHCESVTAHSAVPAGHLGKLKQVSDRIQFLTSFV